MFNDLIDLLLFAECLFGYFCFVLFSLLFYFLVVPVTHSCHSRVTVARDCALSESHKVVTGFDVVKCMALRPYCVVIKITECGE